MIDIEPMTNELPSLFADRLGVQYSQTVTLIQKKNKGQFFTPTRIANFMSSMVNSEEENIRILDPGCGTAILSCALVEHLVEYNIKLSSIDLVAFETDLNLIVHTRHVLEYLKKWLEKRQISLQFFINSNDFVLEHAECISNKKSLFSNTTELFDVVISNPPYFKLSKDDERTNASKIIGGGQPNIYSLFMAISAKLLKKDGQLVFITPRSFTSGSYFKSFREFFFNEIQLEKIHLFVSRKETFSRDNVLQETVILKAVKKLEDYPHVYISSSHGLKDIDDPTVKYISHHDIIDLKSKEKILHFPTNDNDEAILNIFKNWDGTLKKYDIQISTGPVVSFRAWNFVQDSKGVEENILAPLFWLHNVNKMELRWPVKKNNKGQYIKITEQSKSILIPNKNYIFLRRFSSKDDKSRLIAAPYFCNYSEANFIGVENKLNYIYRRNGNLSRTEVIGLCALLNSQPFEIYFRTFNGNVNVSATELREMSLPPLEIINEIGNKIILNNNFSEEFLNNVVTEIFELVDTYVVL